MTRVPRTAKRSAERSSSPCTKKLAAEKNTRPAESPGQMHSVRTKNHDCKMHTSAAQSHHGPSAGSQPWPFPKRSAGPCQPTGALPMYDCGGDQLQNTQSTMRQANATCFSDHVSWELPGSIERYAATHAHFVAQSGTHAIPRRYQSKQEHSCLKRSSDHAGLRIKMNKHYFGTTDMFLFIILRWRTSQHPKRRRNLYAAHVLETSRTKLGFPIRQTRDVEAEQVGFETLASPTRPRTDER